MRSASSFPTRIDRTKACSPFRTTTSSGCRCATISPRRSHAMSRNIRRIAETVSQLSRRLGVPQREAGAGTFPSVHAIRRRYRGFLLAAADAEICMMAAERSRSWGSGWHYVIKINNRKILDGAPGNDRSRWRGHAKADAPRRAPSINTIGSKLEASSNVGQGRKDESGDSPRCRARSGNKSPRFSIASDFQLATKTGDLEGVLEVSAPHRGKQWRW